MKPGENLQRLVRALEQATNNSPTIKVESPKRLPDRDTGRLREHDVVITYALGHHSMTLSLECRDRSRPIGVPDVEAFSKKCERTGVNKGIMVSATGFARTAIKKAETMEIACLGLEEADRFNWCETPGVQYNERYLIDGPPWEFSVPRSFDGPAQLYEVNGNALGPVEFSNLAQNCLKQRPYDVAAREDASAVENPVTCTFLNDGASSFYLLDCRGIKVPLSRMVIHVRYGVRQSLIPFSFKKYIDYVKGSNLYDVAFAQIDQDNLRGELVLHQDANGVRMSFVSRELS